jgi:ATP-dependent HslUV protease ATP-binding subunit HslU
MRKKIDELTPKEIVEELDKYIIGQNNAKKVVAIALRNRVRRRRLSEELRDEVAPKNIIMIGPTGVGKTEIARRLSRLCGAPFVKVEATKYTEVGYVGRDVESMVRDLMSVSIGIVKAELQEEVKEEAEKRSEETLLDLLLPGVKKNKEKKEPSGGRNIFQLPIQADQPVRQQNEGADREGPETGGETGGETGSENGGETATGTSTREKFRKMLREGKLDEKTIEISVTKNTTPSIEIFSGSSFEEMGLNMGNLSNILGGKKKKKLVTVKQAKEIVLSQELDKLVDNDQVSELARERTEQMGIIFIDEIDKIAAKENRSGVDVSREGVQRDILPIVEGNTINTKYGMVNTSHILFIAAGAFHISKPSDLIPELQGRFPLRVELSELSREDFQKILTQPQNALIRQYVEMLKTENVTLEFVEEAIEKISLIAADVNSKTENIGARRLHTIMELLLEDISFTAPDLEGQTVTITPDYVDERLQDVVKDHDLSRYIL